MHRPKPQPLKVGDRVRIGFSGHVTWTVWARTADLWTLTNEHGQPRYVHISSEDQLRRVNGVPIAPSTGVHRSCDSPHALTLNDKVRYAHPSRRPCKTATMWTVVYLDNESVEIATPKRRRYLTWRDVEQRRIVRPDGRPIALPDGAHV